MSRIVKILATVAGAGIVALGAAGAHASSFGRPCTTAPENTYLSAAELQAKAEAQGYQVRRVKIEKACGEIYVTDRNGVKGELFVDPTSGAVLGSK
ncbi:PepSY domain-containing protein [Rhodovastum atsumiense]|uniref:PepSY domain-containing protein n=1 Tax=Rhodovastum atsumiense TaxID=504468 RepID=A0A5M6INK7_9PROT|nr:PepSY domain-containing protein [Rhodovastum atsumiense]KAA5609853.1 PepSY domain-containing protein [Rhodovastum atsumiense]CAH2602452.1 PepSY domain-containing protein [Rhodovastum atsumiense]